MPTSLLLTRHGQSTWNAERRWQGQADPPLSELGRQQAAAAAAAIGSVDTIVSSPQERALETATIIAGLVGIDPVLIEDDLRERSAGIWSGLTHDEIRAEYPGWLDDGRRPEGYELDERLVARVMPALERVVEHCPDGSILVVCHGGVIRAVETHLGLDEGRVPNLSGRLLVHHADRPEGDRWAIGDQVPLLDPELTTGGDGQRV